MIEPWAACLYGMGVQAEYKQLNTNTCWAVCLSKVGKNYLLFLHNILKNIERLLLQWINSHILFIKQEWKIEVCRDKQSASWFYHDLSESFIFKNYRINLVKNENKSERSMT